MPSTVASLRDFRPRRAAGAGEAGAPPRAGERFGADAGGAAMADPAASAAADRARRFRELALPQLDAAYNLARHLARNADAAEDIVQDAYLRALRGFDGYRGGDPKAWLLRIVRNCFYDWARERRSDPTVPLPGAADGDGEDAGPDLPDPDGETPEEALAGADDASLVRALVAGLPAPFREALVLREMEELSYRQIAEAVGAPIGTVMSRLARAREMFGQAWRRHAAGEGGKAR